MPLFIAAIFLSAFLLFQVQPIIARYILPWYGGSPAVWTTCLLFFQMGLLGGYAYAHGLVTLCRERRKLQVGIHLTLLLLVFAVLPITPSAEWKPEGSNPSPLGGIVHLLTMTVGLPYLLLSASGPLLQHWFGEIYPNRSPYRLYAVSNLGSLLALLTYPFLFEPLLDLKKQTTLWSGAFVVYALLVIVTAILFFRVTKDHPSHAASERDLGSRPALLEVILWIAFSACGSMLLLSLTNQMCQDVAVVPFLWVLPLSLYLLTFVIAFDHERWYLRKLAIPLAAAAIGMTVWLMNLQFASSEWSLSIQILIYCSAIFFACLVCHGEIVRMKPRVRYLTGFYLSISLGGAIGGALVSLVAPHWFTGYWELHLSFILLALLVTVQLGRVVRSSPPSIWNYPLALVWTAALAVMLVYLNIHRNDSQSGVIAVKRGFYGVLRVAETYSDTEYAYRSLYHGRINHGRQSLEGHDRVTPSTYYSAESGVGAVFKSLPARRTESSQPIHVGVIGLGIGTIASYAEAGDRFRIYEINPQVEELARSHFFYLADCKGEESVVLGDARISLEHELATGQSQQFDALFVDAFSGDSIPIHLLTKEAFALYFEHLKPDGVLAVHITNLHLDLTDPVRNLAEFFEYEAFRVDHTPDFMVPHGYYSDWVLISKDPEFITALEETELITEWDREVAKPILWTDDYSNLFEVTY